MGRIAKRKNGDQLGPHWSHVETVKDGKSVAAVELVCAMGHHKIVAPHAVKDDGTMDCRLKCPRTFCAFFGQNTLADYECSEANSTHENPDKISEDASAVSEDGQQRHCAFSENKRAIDSVYVGLPWKAGGRDRTGLDCAGLALLWLREQLSFEAPEPPAMTELPPERKEEFNFKQMGWERGDVLFFRHRRKGIVCHVAMCLGQGKVLHIVHGNVSRIENGIKLIERLGLDCIGALSPKDADVLCRALANPELGDVWVAIIEIVIELALVAASIALAPNMPSLAAHKNAYGRYGQTTQGANLGLLTQKSPEIPLPDLLGSIVIAGNSVYQQLADKGATVDSNPQQMWNLAIVLCSAPANLILADNALQLNGVSLSDVSFYNGAAMKGIQIDPDQTKAAAVSGSFSPDSNVPTVSLYPGTYDINVPVDIRAQFDRNFPVYGFAGCSYLVFRFADATKFQTLALNLNVRVQGRLCREFDSSGFIVQTITSEAHTADGLSARIKLDNEDIIAVSAVDIDGTTYTEMGPGNQGAITYTLNKTKGFLHFNVSVAVGMGSVVTVSYTCYRRSWTRNPVSQLVYLLTEPVRGKGFLPDRIDWPAAVAARDYCDETVDWVSSSGVYSTPRFQTDYALDFRKPIQDHMLALLDACQGYLFLSGGKFTIGILQAQSSVFSFDTSNILLDESGSSTFQGELTDRSAKPNRVYLLFHSADTLNAETSVIADDPVNQANRESRVGNNGVVDENLKFPALTEVPQAERLAQCLLTQSIGSKWRYSWKTNIQGLPIQPGDVVDVTHPSLPGETKLLRVDNLEYDNQDRLAISASEYVESAYI